MIATVPIAELIIGSSIVLGLGAIGSLVARQPGDRQRLGELAVSATLVFLVLATVPLPRLGRAEAPVAPMTVAAATDVVRETSVSLDAAPRFDLPAAPTAKVNWSARAYAFGSAVAAIYLLLGFVLVRRLVRDGHEPPVWLASLFAERRARLGAPRARLRITTSRCRPLSAGVLRPTVLLPSVMASPVRAEDLRRVIDHELVHVRRRDAVGRVMFALGAVALWPHPLFWFLRSRANLAAELIADDVAASLADRRAYARGVLALSEELQSLRPAPGLAPGTFRNRSELTRRIEMLVHQEGGFATRSTPARRTLLATATLTAIAGSAAFFGARALPAQEPSMPPRAEQPAPAPAPAPVADPAPQLAPSAIATPAVAPAQPQSAALAAPAPVAQIAPVAQAAPMPPTDPQLEAILALVDRALSLRMERDMVMAEAASLQRRVDLGAVDEMELATIQARKQGVERRLEAALILVRSEMEATQLEMAGLAEAVDAGTLGNEGRIMLLRLNARLEVLRTAL